MLIDINKVRVSDRIRKDYGDIDDLAQDIKENGLINPPVVTPDFELIAGERRLRALKSLGYQQIEVRIMTARDEEHQLNLEISENENRKEFTRKERFEYTQKLIDLKGVNGVNRHQAEDEAAKESGIGSRKQLYREKAIIENADEQTLEAWDKGDITTHAAYQTILKEKKDLEQLLEDERNKPPIEITPPDYELLKSRIEIRDKKIEGLQRDIEILESKANMNEKDAERYQDLKAQIELLTKEKDNIGRVIKSTTELSALTVEAKEFFKSHLAPIKYSRAIQEACQDPIIQRNLSEILDIFQGWINEMNCYISNHEIAIVVEGRVIDE